MSNVEKMRPSVVEQQSRNAKHGLTQNENIQEKRPKNVEMETMFSQKINGH